MKAKEVLDTLKISRRTLTRYVKNNIIKATRLPTGQYIYDNESVYNLVYIKRQKMSKGFKKALEITNNLNKLPHKDLFMNFMEYAYDNGYGNKIIELFNNYLTKGE